MDDISALRALLKKQPPGRILETYRLRQLLSHCWHEFEGSSQTSMKGDKLFRIEEPEWHPPILSFSIERHGQTVMGSKRASLQEWGVNVENLTVSIVRERKRQLVPNAKRLDVELIAKKVVDAILSGRNDERFKIRSDGMLKIEIGRVIPETKKQTTSSRRIRFRKALTALLEPHGWKEVRANLYARSEGSN